MVLSIWLGVCRRSVVSSKKYVQTVEEILYMERSTSEMRRTAGPLQDLDGRRLVFVVLPRVL